MTMKHFKKLLCLVLAVCALTALPVSADSTAPRIKVISTVCASGETSRVQLYLLDNPGLVTLRATVEFDSSLLTLNSVSDGGILGEYHHSDCLSSPYTLYWANDTADSNYTADGVLAELYFDLSDKALDGDKAQISIAVEAGNHNAFDSSLSEVQIEVSGGTVTVQNAVTGLETPFLYAVKDGQLSVAGVQDSVTGLEIAESYEGLTVTAISDGAFAGQSALTNVTLPDSLTSIGVNAFLYCTALESLDIPDGLETIGADAFYGCESLKIYCYDGTAAQSALAEKGISYLLYGDLNRDLILNAPDLVEMKKGLLTGELSDRKCADITRNGQFDILDFIRLKKAIS